MFEMQFVDVLVTSCVENFSIIVQISSIGHKLDRILLASVDSTKNMEINWVLLKISSSADIQCVGILERNNKALS